MANGPVRHTKQKDAVMAQLRGCDDFISAQELHRKLVDCASASPQCIGS